MKVRTNYTRTLHGNRSSGVGNPILLLAQPTNHSYQHTTHFLFLQSTFVDTQLTVMERSKVDFIWFWYRTILLWSPTACCSVLTHMFPTKSSTGSFFRANPFGIGEKPKAPRSGRWGASLFTSHGIRATHKYHGSHETPRTVISFSVLF